MKILISSHALHPLIGGIESASEALAMEFVRRGHEVGIVTQTPGEDKPEWGFRVLRKPGWRALLDAVQWCDVFFHNNVSLQTAWPLLVVRRPWVVTHQTWIARQDGQMGWQDGLKRLLLRFACNVAISGAVARSLPVPSVQIPNPYRADIFERMPEGRRERDLVFLGRLVSDKGADLLIDALARLKAGGLTPALTIAGSGPEEAALKAQAERQGVAAQVEFAGSQTGRALARLLNAHRVLVVPSRWAEPFGIVALEGIACGCGVVGSAEGGLPDAMGPCGIAFPNGDAPALAGAIRAALTQTGLREQWTACAPEHLARHTAGAIAEAYLTLFEKEVRR